MRAFISKMIRRPASLGIALASMFLIGIFVGSVGIPMVWRDVTIYGVGNATKDGCHGGFGVTPIRFGRVDGPSLGSYTIPCEKYDKITDTVWLRCECPQH